MTAVGSAIYSGKVRHRRMLPVSHEFTYNISLYYMDLDEIDSLMAASRWLSCTGWNIGQFKRSDYMEPFDQSLKSIAVAEVERALSCSISNPKVYLLTNLRQWGQCFNPVSLYYVYDAQELIAIVAEVNNTPWKERHRYVVGLVGLEPPYQQSFAKCFHVSPFNPMDMQYRWQCNEPGSSLDVHMENWAGEEKHMDATLSLHRKSWVPTNLNRSLLRTPFNSLKVSLSIYWQAAKLWWKKAPIYDHIPKVNHKNCVEEAARDKRNSP
ncbi:DUF1365 domain-containing protein [Gilvimarinus sp. SDUM040013]|uniref:DUF1365 domain-containing protein n=1 Tax=Gilvimarinus gilvus TaxID=3058038 RepID=A0ABU4S2L6_9GAMM|nr:DUF1365 domain-containing protein [Gilvimarinus sp. SDUM040013]MDO3385570.1 DUF1365 domain-containing protein [Gilvimarinus sp. SDUM040013]MDX6851179.1 DUF1365 domain-containing protein [Gilvimarinus sp. SDUM040013]